MQAEWRKHKETRMSLSFTSQSQFLAQSPSSMKAGSGKYQCRWNTLSASFQESFLRASYMPAMCYWLGTLLTYILVTSDKQINKSRQCHVVLSTMKKNTAGRTYTEWWAKVSLRWLRRATLGKRAVCVSAATLAAEADPWRNNHHQNWYHTLAQGTYVPSQMPGSDFRAVSEEESTGPQGAGV